MFSDSCPDLHLLVIFVQFECPFNGHSAASAHGASTWSTASEAHWRASLREDIAIGIVHKHFGARAQADRRAVLAIHEHLVDVASALTTMIEVHGLAELRLLLDYCHAVFLLHALVFKFETGR